MRRSVEPDGAILLCGTVTPADGAATTVCEWMRSGTGFVQLVLVGADPASGAAVTRQLVSELTAAG